MFLQFQRQCLDVCILQLESVELNRGRGESRGLDELEVIQCTQLLPSIDDVNGKLVLNVTSNYTLSTNMFYQATLIYTMGMIEAGSARFCKCVI